MNRAHRLADQFRNVVGWLGRVPTESNFVSKGFLTPIEFVEAGDQLVFQCPSWQWQACSNKRYQVSWLPNEKQYLLTRNIPCRHRVVDWDRTFFRQGKVNQEGWLVPGPQPGTHREYKLRTAEGLELGVRHEMSSDEENEVEQENNEVAEDADFTLVEDAGAGGTSAVLPTRSYDLSITYDKYYQSPRLWLFGYDERGVPLRSEAVFEDIHTDYRSKTVTVDPHPFTGVPTVSIHPCKHAAVMRTLAQNWISNGMEPRHDLALFVLLKIVSSVVPTLNYDFTIDIEMPGRKPNDSDEEFE